VIKLRNFYHKSCARLSDFLVYHRFRTKPLSFFESTLKEKIQCEVDRIYKVLNSLPDKLPALFANGMFNQYGAFLLRDLITKDLFDITDYEYSELYNKVSKQSIKSNSSPEIIKVCIELRKNFHVESNDYSPDFNESTYVKIFDDLISILLLKFFAGTDARNFVDSYIHAISAHLVYERHNYLSLDTEDSIKAHTALEEYLFEVLNDSVGIYSFNLYEKTLNSLPIYYSNRMVSTKMKQKMISEGRYFFQQKRKPSDIYLFKKEN
jgi:hypothetical protein